MSRMLRFTVAWRNNFRRACVYWRESDLLRSLLRTSFQKCGILDLRESLFTLFQQQYWGININRQDPVLTCANTCEISIFSSTKVGTTPKSLGADLWGLLASCWFLRHWSVFPQYWLCYIFFKKLLHWNNFFSSPLPVPWLLWYSIITLRSVHIVCSLLNYVYIYVYILYV